MVASAITKSGSVISGNISQMATIVTDPGYDSNPGHAGTGTVVSVSCEGLASARQKSGKTALALPQIR
jgi:hypothetical protein